MDLSALKMFLAVAHERSFSRAAAVVHRTQPAVSQAVRRLEADILADAQLAVFEALPHAFWYHFQLPETKEALELMAKFFSEKLEH